MISHDNFEDKKGIKSKDVIVSVVLPVYNCSDYLSECVDSLLKQSFIEAEYIFVDDGSTDDSLLILNQYQRKDNRIIILSGSKENAGVARNKGLAIARGKYVVFLDADDFYKPSLLKDAYEAAERTKAQIVIYDNSVYDNVTKKTIKKIKRKLPREVFKYSDLPSDSYDRCSVVPWNKMFCLDFIRDKKISFQSIRRCNDKSFVVTALASAERIYHIPKDELSYRRNNINSLQGSRDNGREDYILSLIELKKELTSRNLYSGNIRESFICLSKREIKSGMKPPYSYGSLKRFFFFTKENLLPGIFDCPEDFKNDEETNLIYEAPDFETFLLSRMQMKETETIDKRSLEYKVGGYAFRILQRIRSLV